MPRVGGTRDGRVTRVECHVPGTLVVGPSPVRSAREHDEWVGDQPVQPAPKRAHIDLCWIGVGEQGRGVVQRVGST